MLRYVIFLFFIQLIFISCDKQLSVSQPEPPPPKAKIKISTNPQGYSIHLDNRISGLWTPDSFLFLDYGEHTIGLRDSIFLDTTFTVTIPDDRMEELYVDMTSRSEFYGDISVNSFPENATIVLNDSLTSFVTPAKIENLYPGEYRINFLKRGYRAPTYKITVKSNKVSNCRGVLEDTTIWLVYNTSNSFLPTNSLECIDIDRQNTGDIWIGSSDAGVICVKGERMIHYALENNSIPANYIQKIIVNIDGDVLVSSPYGASIFNNSMWQIFNSQEGYLSSVNSVEFNYYYKFISTTGTVKRIFRYYFSTMGQGIIKLEDGIYERFNHPKLHVTPMNVNATIHNSGIMVIATHDEGLYVSDNNISNWTHYDHTNTTFWDYEGKCRISAIAVRDFGGDIYAGVNFAPGAGQLFYSSNPGDGNIRVWNEINVNYAKVYQILIAMNNIWVATSKGLFLIQNNTEVIKQFTTENSGLPSNTITGVAVDRGLNVWMSTSNGLVRYKP